MYTSEIAEKYSINRAELDTFLMQSDLKYKTTMLNGILVKDDPELVVEKFYEFVRNKKIEESAEAERKKQRELDDAKKNAIEGGDYYINDSKKAYIESMIQKARMNSENDLIYYIKGSRGRHLKVYPYKIIIRTDVTVGSVITSNATDGEKTIYLKSCTGIQYKRPGLTLGYIQFETNSGIMNNEKSNFFNENTFTFEENNIMDEVYEFIIGQMDELAK